MTVITAIKAEVRNALAEKKDVKKNILRFVLGEAQTLEVRTNQPVSDEQVYNIIRKTIQANNETLTKGPSEKLDEENQILSALLPQVWSLDEIEAFLNPSLQSISEAKSDGQAIGVAMKALKAVSAPINNADVGVVVKKLRTPK